jgi:hypothetical protein
MPNQCNPSDHMIVVMAVPVVASPLRMNAPTVSERPHERPGSPRSQSEGAEEQDDEDKPTVQVLHKGWLQSTTH